MTHAARRSASAIALCLFITGLLTASDLWTKGWATEHLPCVPGQVEQCRSLPGRHAGRGGVLVVVEDYLDLAYAENRGAAFSMLHDAPEWVRLSLFTLTAVGFSFAMLWMFVSGSGGTLFVWAVPLIVSGALGNVIDRWRLGYVVDFIRFHLQDGWEWPTFNVADITIAVGAALLILDGFGKVGESDDSEGVSPAVQKQTS